MQFTTDINPMTANDLYLNAGDLKIAVKRDESNGLFSLSIEQDSLGEGVKSFVDTEPFAQSPGSVVSFLIDVLLKEIKDAFSQTESDKSNPMKLLLSARAPAQKGKVLDDSFLKKIKDLCSRSLSSNPNAEILIRTSDPFFD